MTPSDFDIYYRRIFIALLAGIAHFVIASVLIKPSIKPKVLLTVLIASVCLTYFIAGCWSGNWVMATNALGGAGTGMAFGAMWATRRTKTKKITRNSNEKRI